MSTYTQILYQIVFSTKNREACLIKDKREELYSYIWGIVKNKKCHLYRIGGVEDHIHIVTHLHQSIALADLVKDIKTASSNMIKAEKMFKGFSGWQIGYGAFTMTKNIYFNNIMTATQSKVNNHVRSAWKTMYAVHGKPCTQCMENHVQCI